MYKPKVNLVVTGNLPTDCPVLVITDCLYAQECLPALTKAEKQGVIDSTILAIQAVVAKVGNPPAGSEINVVSASPKEKDQWYAQAVYFYKEIPAHQAYAQKIENCGIDFNNWGLFGCMVYA